MKNWQASLLGVVVGAFVSPVVDELKYRLGTSRETRFAKSSVYAELAFLQRRLKKVTSGTDQAAQLCTLRDTRSSALSYFTDRVLPVLLRIKEPLAIINIRPLLEQTLNPDRELSMRVAAAKETLCLIDYYTQARVLDSALLERARGYVKSEALNRERWFREAQEQ